jgi:hypothetical protein
MEEKILSTIGGAHKYAENASRKYSDTRYVVEAIGKYFVRTYSDLEDIEKLVAIYKNGEKIL